MQTDLAVGILFVGLAVIFLTLSLQGHLREHGKGRTSHNTWLRIALIFAVVGIGLAIIHILTR